MRSRHAANPEFAAEQSTKQIIISKLDCNTAGLATRETNHDVNKRGTKPGGDCRFPRDGPDG